MTSTTWFLVAWFSFTPGKWTALELPTTSQAECHKAVATLAQHARDARAHEFVIHCEERLR